VAVAFRSDNEVTNGTAGTSVTVSKPSGIVDTGNDEDRDQLLAFVATVGVTTITPPADWVLVTSAVDGTNAVKLYCYRKLASSEGASWTWTLGSSVRNWGWVGAWTGVDPDDPVAESATDLTLDSSTILSATIGAIPAYGAGIGTAAAVRTASGAATTWTHSSTVEDADLSTNAGAGTDIGGVVGHRIWSVGEPSPGYAPTMTASQSQTAGVGIALALSPYFVPYTGEVAATGVVLEAAEGVDPDSDSSTWEWTDLTSKVLESSRIVLEHGRSNRAAIADPSKMTFTLKNLNGEFTSPTGTYTGSMVRNLPFRVRMNGFGTDVGGDGYHRGTAFLASMRPRWDESTNLAVVDVVAQGRLRRAQQRTKPLHSAGYRAITGVGGGIFALGSDRFSPLAYWPFEDESAATAAASAVPGVGSLAVSGVTFGADATLVGSAPVATLATGALIDAVAPPSVDVGYWAGLFLINIPTEPAATTTVMDFTTTGTAPTWRVELVPGGTAQFHVRAYDSSGTSLLDQASGALDSYFGDPFLIFLSARQTGADINYRFWALNASDPATGFGLDSTLSGYTTGRLTGMRLFATVGLDGASFGHLAMYNDPDYDDGNDPQTASNAVGLGKPAQNERPDERFTRLCLEENVPATADVPDQIDIAMGPQSIDTLVALLRESGTIDGTVLNDSGQTLSADLLLQTGLLWLPARSDRENRDATMTLDIASGHVAPPFEPTLDDQDIVNDVEVSRTGGSSARVSDEDHIAVEGRYDERVTVNTADDTFLRHLAGLRVNLGTVRGMRFPSVSWNLRKSPSLAQQWMACRLFHRIDVTNPPSQYPPDDIETILEGYTEIVSAAEWSVRANLSPYLPNRVFELAETSADAGEYVGRLAEDATAALRIAIDDNDTSIVFDPNAFRWSAVADDFDPDLSVTFGGEVASVSSIATTAATYVGRGALSSADNAAVTPATTGFGAADGDLLLCLGRIRGTAGSLSTASTGWELMAQVANLYLWGAIRSGATAITVTPTGGSAGDVVSATVFAFHNTPLTANPSDMVLDEPIYQTNASAQDIAYPRLCPRYPGNIVLLLAGKSDDWTSVAVPSGLTESGEPSTTTGADQGLYLAYAIQTTPTLVPQGSLVVTGGTSAVSEAMMLALAAGYQTMTVSARSVNGVVKSHAVGTTIAVTTPGVMGL
jgi:hypothetical protein